jgi:chorismate mutase
MTTAASTEFPAAARFSERIKFADEIAELPDMHELSPLRAERAKQITLTIRAVNGTHFVPVVCRATTPKTGLSCATI